jgi:thiol-disulfide isomerase/thioredoxin
MIGIELLVIMSIISRIRGTSSAAKKSSVIDLTEADFDECVHRNDIVMVMFCKPECPHCIRMEPIYQELGEELVDRALFCRVNILTNINLRRKFEITGTPTFVLIKHGSIVRSMRGESTKDLLKDEVVRLF